MADPNDDLFSDLEPIAAPVPSRPDVPSLADGLRELGLLDDQHESAQQAVDTAEPIVEVEDKVGDAALVSSTEEQAHSVWGEPVAEADPAPQVDPVPASSIEPEREQAPAPAPDPEPVATIPQVEPMAVSVPRPQPGEAQNSISRRRWPWVAGGALVAVAIGGLVFGTTYKESTAPAAPPVPAVAKQDPPPVAEPPVPVAPAPEPGPEPVVVAVVEQPEPEAKPMAVPPPTTAPAVPPTPAAKPKREKPKSNPTPTPAEKEPKRQWQDDAMDALDDLEKRL